MQSWMGGGRIGMRYPPEKTWDQWKYYVMEYQPERTWDQWRFYGMDMGYPHSCRHTHLRMRPVNMEWIMIQPI